MALLLSSDIWKQGLRLAVFLLHNCKFEQQQESHPHLPVSQVCQRRMEANKVCYSALDNCLQSSAKCPLKIGNGPLCKTNKPECWYVSSISPGLKCDVCIFYFISIHPILFMVWNALKSNTKASYIRLLKENTKREKIYPSHNYT